MRERTTKLIDLFVSLSTPRDFSLSPDGSTIAFVLEINGYSQIFSLPTTRGAWPRRLTAMLSDCDAPQWSPDGTRLAFVSDTALWVMNADGTDAHKLTDHPSGNAHPRWSPDGSRIAFYSRRRGWEHIWTISLSDGKLYQVLRGEFDGDDLVWSPDSKWLAYCSVRERDLMTRGVYLIPAEGDDEILISPHGCWSGAPHFSPDGRTLAYLSDRDGWFHIYLYDLRTRETSQITHGEFEVGGPYFYNVDPHGGPIFSPDGKQLAYLRHREGKFDVWVTDLDGNHARRVSPHDGHYRLIDWLPDSKRIAVQFDNPAYPQDLWIISTDGRFAASTQGTLDSGGAKESPRVQAAEQITDSRAADLNSDAIISPEWVSYTARDGLTIPAAMYRPRDQDAPRAPAVLFLHGGPNFQFANYFYPLPQLLAQEGYVVLAPNFRGSTGYGTAFRHANFREWGHADAFDVIDGARWLAQQEFVDPERMAVMGPSYGAYLTLCALTLEPELFCAGIDMYGDSEIRESYYHGDRHGRLDLKRQMGKPPENPEGYRRGSPFYFAERIQAPLLILHGKEDRLVVPLMSEKMIEALKIEDKYFESQFYDGEEHGFQKAENKKDAWERVIKFLNRHCKGEE